LVDPFRPHLEFHLLLWMAPKLMGSRIAISKELPRSVSAIWEHLLLIPLRGHSNNMRYNSYPHPSKWHILISQLTVFKAYTDLKCET